MRVAGPEADEGIENRRYRSARSDGKPYEAGGLRYPPRVAVLRLFASAREAAGTNTDTIEGATVGAVLDAACARYGAAFTELLPRCKVWRNGEPAERHEPVVAADEVAVLPPVSGGDA